MSVYAEYPYLNDENFLKEVDELKFREEYAKIVLLNWKEEELEEIQGIIQSGNVNIDNSSSIRRTASLSMFCPEEELDYKKANSKISINKKVKVFVGIRNTLTKYIEFPILWFPIGVLVITQANISHSASGVTISLTFKDKMVLLNGECGGMLPASVTFSEMENYDPDTGVSEIYYPTMYQIIQEAVNHWGNEQLGKILIKGLDKRVKQVVRWNADVPIYLHVQQTNNSVQSCQVSYVPCDGYKEYAAGEDIGYIYTDFTYPGELIGDAGTPITNILDKIRDTLGNFEYFYDIDGVFHFQEIENYLNTSQTSNVLTQLNRSQTSDTVYNYSFNKQDSTSYIVDAGKGKSVYDFTNSDLILSYSNSPDYSNIKNDFLVWGIRKNAAGMELPIRYHLAIDKKPAPVAHNNIILYEDADGLRQARKGNNDEGETITAKDWRTELYLQGVEADKNGTDTGYYYAELMNEWQKQYDLTGRINKNHRPGFLDEVVDNPAGMDFFLDFIDTNSALGDYSVSAIGRRTKVLTDNSINCIFEPMVNDVIFISTDMTTYEGLTPQQQEQECRDKKQVYCRLDDEAYEQLAIGGFYNGADVAIKDLLYQYTNYNESISFQCIPIYHLDVNKRITVRDPESGIADDFIIKNISCPLGYNGTMTINANKALTKI